MINVGDKFSIQNPPNRKDHSIPVIYKIINLVNKKIYVGSAEVFWRRFRNYKNSENPIKTPAILMERAVRKYGFDKFEFEILEVVENIETILKREQFWLDTLKPFGKEIGYNINPCAWSRKGLKLSAESRKKISDNSTTSRPVYQIGKTTHTIVGSFKSARDAEKSIKLGNGFVSRVCLGIRPTAGGYFWCYQDEYDKFSISQEKRNIRPVFQYDNNELVKEWPSISSVCEYLTRDKKTVRIACNEHKLLDGYEWRFK